MSVAGFPAGSIIGEVVPTLGGESSYSKNHNNSYKGKHSIGAGLQFKRFSLLSSWKEGWQHPGRYGAGGDESSIF